MNKFIPFIAAMLLTVALFAVMVLNFPNRVTFSAAAATKEIYLTFDDGPSDAVTPKILDVLKAEKVPATFFIVGVNGERRIDILKRAYNEGHTLAVHSNSHKYSRIYSSAPSLLEDIEKCNELICRITGGYSSFYRFPGGSFGVAEELKDAVRAAGYEIVDWNASFRDSEIKDATAGKLYTAALDTVVNENRIVMLAHDSSDKTETPAALKEVIRHFKKCGYTFKKF